MVSGIHDFDALLTVYGVCDPFDFVCYEAVKCLYEFVDFFLHGRMELCVYVFFSGCFLSQYKSSVFRGIHVAERLPKWQIKHFLSEVFNRMTVAEKSV